ncbi:hypothetical protein [Peribacillus sp. SCS-155]|uniref:hypothetical protein n=1 Tax=Peribacillus sedimenti TaxID=3115297 RepID=UPI003906273C
MKLLKWSYWRRNHIRAWFDLWPNSPVIFRRVRNYYFIYSAQWSKDDLPVPSNYFEKMELLLNRDLGLEQEYVRRKANKKEGPH